MIEDPNVIYPSTIFKLSTIIMTAIFSLIVLLLSSAYILKIRNRYLPTDLIPIVTVDYTRSSSATLGTNLIPILNVPVQIGNYESTLEFLIDSGAVVSTVPLLHQTGANLDQLNRIVLGSATDHVTYGYLTDMDLKLEDATLTIPVALSDISVPVLGRRGFFDRYTLIFDHQSQAVTIAQSKE
jgi:hypothetical protein